MCGINLLLESPRGDNDILEMNSVLSHRGLPGRSSITAFYNDRVKIGHVRLPIQGLSTDCDQPIFMGDLVGAFVGEVFNFRSFNPGAATDLPVILEQYSKLGDRAFREFDGFWALVILDTRLDMVHIFTDYLAKKPLYIRKYSNGSWGISSEIGPLWQLEQTTLDELFFSTVIKWGYSPNDRTPFKEIRKIPPGAHLIYNLKTKNLSRAIYDEITPIHYDLKKVLTQAVKNRLIADVPISLLLSGGLDSTIIFELVKQETFDFTIFHVDNQEARFLNYLKIPPVVKVIPLSISNVDVDEALLFNETPIDLGSVIPQFAMAKAIKEHGFHVALSGDGADELFGGYKRYETYDAQYSDIFHELVFYHLPRLDKLMMSQTIELRCPFLSRPVIESALTIPYEYRKSKEFLKETFKDIVPPEILNRPKRPLKSPQARENRIGWRIKLVARFKELMGSCDLNSKITK